MNALVQQGSRAIGQLSSKFAGLPAEDDLSAGIQGGFGRVGYKGKVWSTNHRGEQRLLLDQHENPIPSIEVVIVKASSVISKTWYEKGYVEGSNEPPDCLSSNGVTPDPGSPKKQCSTCALCPRNAWGSQVKQDGTAGKGKACSDTKRLAVVPLPDIKNELLGGPMLLRVPAASLQDLATYDSGLRKLGYPYYAVGTRISFDAKESFPKFVLKPIRALTDEEADLVLAHRADPAVDRILAEDMPAAAPAAADPPPMQFEQPPATVDRRIAEAPPPATTQAAATATTKAAATATTQAAATATGGFGVAPAPTPAPTGPKTPRRPRAAAQPEATAPVTAPVASPGGFGGTSAPVQEAVTSTGTAPEETAVDDDFDTQLDRLIAS